MIKIGFVQVNYSVGPKSYNGYFFPYSVGVLIAYLKKYYSQFTVTDILFKRDKITDAADKLAGSNIVAFSTYVWNKEYNYALAKELKQRAPNTLIVFGGPEVPVSDVNFFQQHRYVDLVIENEGEISFLKIVENFHTKDFKNIPGVISNRYGVPVRSIRGPERIVDLDDIPSPYLTGVFDSIVQRHLDVNWHITLETNRGCPYQCTFCDWGSLTYTKIKKFQLERVFEEIEWVGRQGYKYIYLADANFGVFPERDELIMDKIVETKLQYGSPIGITLNWAKNQKATVMNIAKKLIANNFDHGLTVSLQTLTESVLEIIKRQNLEINKAKELFDLCRANGVPVNSELILGLPGETLDSWKSNFYKLFRLNHKTMTVYQCQVLENSELNIDQADPHEIRTVLSYNTFTNASADEEIYESLPIVVATKDMPLGDMVTANLWNWFFFTFHVLGLTNFVSEYFEREGLAYYEDFYQGLFEAVTNDPIFSKELNTKRHQIYQWLTTGNDQSETMYGLRLEGIKLYNYGTSCKIHIDKELRNHVQYLIAEYVKSIRDSDTVTDLLEFQKKYLVDLHNLNSYPKQVTFNYNWLDYFVHKFPLETVSTEIMFYSKSNEEIANASVANRAEYIWYKRRISFGMAALNTVNKPAAMSYVI